MQHESGTFADARDARAASITVYFVPVYDGQVKAPELVVECACRWS
ncbi:MAG TPA: hypothetical protein VF469_36710 [Kofleriaceae bacterium]